MLGDKIGSMTVQETSKPIDSGRYGLPAMDTHTVGVGSVLGHDVKTQAAFTAHTNPRTLNGTVVSNKMDKTIVVLVERRVQHPLYGKIVRRSSKVHVHDAQNECEVGDVVTVREAPPMSKTKTWQLVSIDERPAKV